MRVLIACGGSGGHLFPGVAVAEALVSRGHEVRLLVSEKAADNAVLQTLGARAGWAVGISWVRATGYNGARGLWRFGTCLVGATWRCARLCEKFAPHVVLGMGGFTSAPAVWAACWSRTPALLHESNAIPGRANRWSAPVAKHIAVGLADCARHFRGRPVTVTGTPVRAALRCGKVPDARRQLGLEASVPTVLIVGGSQGAHAINEAVVAALPLLRACGVQVQFIHISGSADEGFVRGAYERAGISALVMAFCERMELVYSAADLVVSRAGAGTLTEVAVFGLPSVLIPYPFAAEDHQSHNARVFERAGAARVIRQCDLGDALPLRGKRLSEVLLGLLADETQRREMGEAARSLAVPDAERRIADLIEKHGYKTTSS